ncbi:uncharacterized protein LOC125705003 [Brienomyrus brachyistius]|uniref:uncharacterized protein LOC125705003 n=1 Tax=Brienomyrus brachyistius TaxID=42636 RepID=UPI0020B262B2|nr:uncharacterized protein LOC125705003 [Brienomyrus brachyistius]
MENHLPSCANESVADAIQQGGGRVCWEEGEGRLGQGEGSKQGVTEDEKIEEEGGRSPHLCPSPAGLCMCGKEGCDQASVPSLGEDQQQDGGIQLLVSSAHESEEAVGGQRPSEAPNTAPTGNEAMMEPGEQDGAGWREEPEEDPPSPGGGAISSDREEERTAPSLSEGLGITQGAQSFPELSPSRESFSSELPCFSQESGDALKPRSISSRTPSLSSDTPEGHQGEVDEALSTDASLGPRFQHAVCLPLVSEGLKLLWIQPDQTDDLDGVPELVEVFNSFPYPTQQEAASLARRCALPLDQVKAWFMVQRIRYGISWATEEIEEARHKVFGPPPPAPCTSSAGGHPVGDPDSAPPLPHPHHWSQVSASPMFAVAPPCGRPHGRNGNLRARWCGIDGRGWPSEAEIRWLRAKTGLAHVDIHRWFADGHRRQKELMNRLVWDPHPLGTPRARKRGRRVGEHFSGRGEAGVARHAEMEEGGFGEEGPRCVPPPPCSPTLGASGRLRKRTREQLKQHFLRCLRPGGKGNRNNLRTDSGREQGVAKLKRQGTGGAWPEEEGWCNFGEGAPPHIYSVEHGGTDCHAKAPNAGVTGCNADLHHEGALQGRGMDVMSQGNRQDEVEVSISD